MPEVVKGKQKKRGGQQPKYPFEEWYKQCILLKEQEKKDGKQRFLRLRQGKDFKKSTSPGSFYQNLWRWKKREGKPLATFLEEKAICIWIPHKKRKRKSIKDGRKRN